MSLALLDFKSRREERGGSPGCIDDVSGANLRAIGQFHPSLSDVGNCGSETQLRAVRLGALDEKSRCAGRVENAIFRNQQSALETRTQVWIESMQGIGIEDLGGNAAIGVVLLLAPDLRHFFIVDGDPDGSALLVLGIVGKLGPELLPEALRVASQRELGVGVIHHDDVAHSGGGGIRANGTLVENDNLQAATRALIGAGGADDAGPDDGEVAAGAHARIPMQNGSRASRMSSASALTNADPRMLG